MWSLGTKHQPKAELISQYESHGHSTSMIYLHLTKQEHFSYDQWSVLQFWQKQF